MPDRTEVEREARCIIADDYAGRSVTDDAIEWAVLALEAGFDSPNVLMLAASERPANWFETERYFRAALAEVGVPWPDRDQALRDHARDVAASVVDGSVDPEHGVQRLARYAVALDYPDDMMDLYVLEDELEIRYGPDRVKPEHWRPAARAACERFLSSAGRSAV